MNPFSITTGCIALLGAIVKTSTAIAGFVHGCRKARADLTSVSRELADIQLVIELLRDDGDTADFSIVPSHMRTHILSITANCQHTLDQINEVLGNHSGSAGAMRWAVEGRKQVASLKLSLEAHRGALSLALDSFTLWVSLLRMFYGGIADSLPTKSVISRDIKHDTSVLRQTSVEIKKIPLLLRATLWR